MFFVTSIIQLNVDEFTDESNTMTRSYPSRLGAGVVFFVVVVVGLGVVGFGVVGFVVDFVVVGIGFGVVGFGVVGSGVVGFVVVDFVVEGVGFGVVGFVVVVVIVVVVGLGVVGFGVVGLLVVVRVVSPGHRDENTFCLIAFSSSKVRTLKLFSEAGGEAIASNSLVSGSPIPIA